MTGSRRLVPALPSALLAFAAVFGGPALAQDPAYIGGSGQDPANVQYRPAPSASVPRLPAFPTTPDPRNLPPGVASPDDLDPRPGDPKQTAVKLQQMIDALYRDVNSASSRDPFDRSYQARYDQMMRETDSLAQSNWGQLSSNSQALYRELHRLDSEMRAEQTALDNRLDDPNFALRVGRRQAEEGMRRLGDVLLPMLQDVKRAMDTELRNAATRR